MSVQRDILMAAEQLSNFDTSRLLFHKCRFQELLKRVKVVVSLVNEIYPQSGRNEAISQSLVILAIMLEEILEYLTLFSTKDKQLASHIIKYGSDEEQFIKWTERLQHCVTELKLGPKALDAFDEIVDLANFQKDNSHLQTEILDMVVILHGSDNGVLVKTLETLLGHQSTMRQSYRTKSDPNSELQLNPKKIKYEKVIGHGGFGVVWKGRYKGEPVAIKTIPTQTLTPTSIAALNTEANIMRRLSHPRIVSCFGVCESEGNQCLVMELMETGSLHDYIHHQACPEEWLPRYNIAVDVCQGMSYLHRLNVIHRDLKLGNIVLDGYMRAKITDFGLSVIKNTSVTSIKGKEMGTVQYMAPESFGLAPVFSTKSDVFAFAIILWELAHWKFAYANVAAAEIKDSIRGNDRLGIDAMVPSLVSNMICSCWDGNPKSRPDFSTIAKSLDSEITLLQVSGAAIPITYNAADVNTKPRESNPIKLKSQKLKMNFSNSLTRKNIIMGSILLIIVIISIITAVTVITLSSKNSANQFEQSTSEETQTTTSSPPISSPRNGGVVTTFLRGFDMLRSVTVGNDGNVYVCNSANNTILRVSVPSGMVTVIAGNSTAGYMDGTGSTVMFNDPFGLAVDNSGVVYVADTGNNCIRRIDLNGSVSTIAGSIVHGFVDGPGGSAKFNGPRTVYWWNNTLYIGDSDNNAVRTIDSNGNVQTLAGLGPTNAGFKDGDFSVAKFDTPQGIAVDLDGNLYVADSNNNAIRRIELNRTVITIAGSPTGGFADGQRKDAQFKFPSGVIFDPVGNFLFVSDSGNNVIRLINSTRYVTTFAGNRTQGSADGVKSNAKFYSPQFGASMDSDGTIYIAEVFAGRIRKMS